MRSFLTTLLKKIPKFFEVLLDTTYMTGPLKYVVFEQNSYSLVTKDLVISEMQYINVNDLLAVVAEISPGFSP